MKKFSTILMLVFATNMVSSAQIPNSGFENWTTFGPYEDPNGWTTMNIACAGPFYSCTKSTDHYPLTVGNYSARVQNDTSLTQFTGGYGMIMTNAFDYPFKPAFPIIGHPNTLTGYYQYDSQNNDSLWIFVVLFENGIIVGNDDFTTGITTASWTSFSLPLAYATADSATILLSAYHPSGPGSSPKGNSILYVDNLNFDNLITSVDEEAINGKFNFYPNPAIDVIRLDIDNANNDDITCNIYNSLGELVISEQVQQNSQLVNIGDLNNGMYVVELRSVNLNQRKQLIVRK